MGVGRGGGGARMVFGVEGCGSEEGFEHCG